MRRIVAAIALFLAPFALAGKAAAATVPVVNNGTINYKTNQITLVGTGFEPAKTKPTVEFNGAALAVASFSNTEIVATLPTGLTAGTFDLTVTNSLGSSVDFNLTYGATGPQGPAGPAGAAGPKGPAGATGATGPAGPQGPRGATGGAGPAGENGTTFIFLDAYNPDAAYAANDVVTYNGSSYIAILPNGPNPSGPTPDKNPTWSLMAAGGTGPAGPAGPTGEQGPMGPMGNPGPAGPTGATGPAGSGLLSWASASQTGTETMDPSSQNGIVEFMVPNVGTYLVWGTVTLTGQGSSQVQCDVSASSADLSYFVFGPYSSANLENGTITTVAVQYTAVATASPVYIELGCNNSGAASVEGPAALFAIQVK